MADKIADLRRALPGWALVTLGAVVALIVVGGGFFITYQYAYADEFYPGVRLGTIALGGKTVAEARELVSERVAAISRNGVLVNYNSRTVTMYPTVSSSTDLDFTYDVFAIDVDGSLDVAWRVGRLGSSSRRVVEQLGVLFGGTTVPAVTTVNRPQAMKVLQENFSEFEQPGHDAQLTITWEGDQPTIAVEAEQAGTSLTYETAINTLAAGLADLENQPITLTLRRDEPTVFANETVAAVATVPAVLARAPITITFNDQSWSLDSKAVASVLGFRRAGDRVLLATDEDKFRTYLETVIGPTVNQSAQDAKFKLTNGRVTEFIGSQPGQAIEYDATRRAFDEAIINNKQSTVALVVLTAEPEVLTKDVNDLGIKEILGVGKSSFAGSPKNRRHNIAVGAAALDGLLIKPGEEFSLLKALGAIDGSTGYLPELVIKGNRTIPEFGGGLCQIGTTTFRAALDAGLPITARQSHSYQVQYYAPSGTDATIYDPSPDFRFVNDTGNYILFVAKIVGDDLRFEFWGTKDGRTKYYIGQQESDNFYDIVPKKWGVTSPPPTLYIETLDLPVGEQKCTERAHAGASTAFTYRVTYPDGKQKEQEFKSVYKPWQAVCLIGVEKLTEPITEDDTTTDGQPPAPDVTVVQ